MSHTLSSQLVRDILQHIHVNALEAGTRLPERGLAEALRVSRSPVRAALQQMAQQALIERHPDGGFVVGTRSHEQPVLPEDTESPMERIYLQIAQDRLAGLLPDRITENELMRRYGVTRSQLSDILRRIAHEGWIERLPGHGWVFIEAMTSPDAYAQGYRFRLLIEPAGILEPGFELDAPRLLQCREEQRVLAEGMVNTVSPAQIFDANTRLHETIAACSGNSFILDSLRRLNRIRRLMEYQKAVDREQALRRCKEHLVLIDLLLQRRTEEAAEFMRLHLQSAAREKQLSATR